MDWKVALMRESNSKLIEEKQDQGIRCRKCGCEHFRVVCTRAATGAKLLPDVNAWAVRHG
jgi:hypothetical protein